MRAVYSALGLGVFLLVCIALVEGQDGDECECVDYYLCVNNTIVTEGRRSTGLIEVRANACSGSTKTCCKIPNIIPPGQVTTPPSTYVATDLCGQRNPDGVAFTLSGAENEEANFGEFPWMVALLKEDHISNDVVFEVFECGGSLIHPQVVLTIAHCVERLNIRDIVIRAGEWDTMTTSEPFPHQDRRVSEVILHEEYDHEMVYNDIALVILQHPVTIDEHINVVCLPSQGANFDLARCITGGWGKDAFGDTGREAAVLKKREVPVMPRPRCVNALRTADNARLGPNFELHESFICAGGEPGLDTCTGDGGSPLVCPLVDAPEYYQQAGIVSWGLGCNEPGVPGVYDHVALFRNWIDQKLTSRNLDTSSYTYSKSS